jgi:hypothetical protein
VSAQSIGAVTRRLIEQRAQSPTRARAGVGVTASDARDRPAQDRVERRAIGRSVRQDPVDERAVVVVRQPPLYKRSVGPQRAQLRRRRREGIRLVREDLGEARRRAGGARRLLERSERDDGAGLARELLLRQGRVVLLRALRARSPGAKQDSRAPISEPGVGGRLALGARIQVRRTRVVLQRELVDLGGQGEHAGAALRRALSRDELHQCVTQRARVARRFELSEDGFACPRVGRVDGECSA